MIKSFMRAVRAAQKHLQALILVTFIGAALVAPAASVAQNLGTTRHRPGSTRSDRSHSRKAHS